MVLVLEWMYGSIVWLYRFDRDFLASVQVGPKEDPSGVGLVLEWVYGSIVSTAEKARDGAKRTLGDCPAADLSTYTKPFQYEALCTRSPFNYEAGSSSHLPVVMAPSAPSVIALKLPLGKHQAGSTNLLPFLVLKLYQCHHFLTHT